MLQLCRINLHCHRRTIWNIYPILLLTSKVSAWPLFDSKQASSRALQHFWIRESAYYRAPSSGIKLIHFIFPVFQTFLSFIKIQLCYQIIKLIILLKYEQNTKLYMKSRHRFHTYDLPWENSFQEGCRYTFKIFFNFILLARIV